MRLRSWSKRAPPGEPSTTTSRAQLRRQQGDDLAGRQTEARHVLGDRVGAHREAGAVEEDVAAVPVQARANHAQPQAPARRPGVERLHVAVPLRAQRARHQQHAAAAPVPRRHGVVAREDRAEVHARERDPPTPADGAAIGLRIDEDDDARRGMEVARERAEPGRGRWRCRPTPPTPAAGAASSESPAPPGTSASPSDAARIRRSSPGASGGTPRADRPAGAALAARRGRDRDRDGARRRPAPDARAPALGASTPAARRPRWRGAGRAVRRPRPARRGGRAALRSTRVEGREWPGATPSSACGPGGRRP